VNNPIAGAILTPVLMCALPAFAQEATVPTPVPAAAPVASTENAKAPPQLFDADLLKLYLDVMKDVKRISNHHSTLKERVELARNFTFSPETKAELKTQFGNDDPLHLTVEDLPGGGAAIHGKSDALDHTDAKSGAALHIDPFTAESVVNRNYNGIKFNITIPDVKLTSTGDLKLLDVNDISVTGDNTIGPYNFQIGKSSGKVGRMHFSGGTAFALDLNDLNVDADVTARNKMFDLRYLYRVASVDWGSDKVENINTDISIVNVDGQSMEDLVDFAESVNVGNQPDAAQTDAMMKMLKRFAITLSKHNGAIDIRDLSAQYHGERAGLSGRVTLPNLKQADLDSVQKTYEKLAVRLRLHVPMSMIDEITHRFSRTMMEAQAKQSGTPVTDMAVDLVARGLVGKMTDTLVKQQKWAHMEKAELVTVFEVKKGKMYLDGHVVNAKSNPFMAMAQGK
jgi:uncharacterized protein YdgA (DUF945 family)